MGVHKHVSLDMYTLVPSVLEEHVHVYRCLCRNASERSERRHGRLCIVVPSWGREGKVEFRAERAFMF